MYATHRLAMGSLFAQSEIISRLSLTLSLSRVVLYYFYFDFIVQLSMYIHIYFLLSFYPFSRVPHRASSSLLYSFTVSRPVRPPLFSPPSSSFGLRLRTQLASTAALPRRAVCWCVSLSIARTFSLVCRLQHPPSSCWPLAPRVPSSFPPARFGLRFLRAACPSPLSPTSGVSVVASAEGRSQKHAARPC